MWHGGSFCFFILAFKEQVKKYFCHLDIIHYFHNIHLWHCHLCFGYGPTSISNTSGPNRVVPWTTSNKVKLFEEKYYKHMCTWLYTRYIATAIKTISLGLFMIKNLSLYIRNDTVLNKFARHSLLTTDYLWNLLRHFVGECSPRYRCMAWLCLENRFKVCLSVLWQYNYLDYHYRMSLFFNFHYN